MKTTFTFLFAALLAFGQAASINQENLDFQTYSLVDEVIKVLLNGFKSQLANLTIPDIDEKVESPELNATIKIKNITLQNADKFEIVILKSKLLPLQLSNLTLFFKNIETTGYYDVNASFAIAQVPKPISVYGKGIAKGLFDSVRFTIGANLEMKGLHVQIKPKGLFGFDLNVGNTNITIESIMGSEDLGHALGIFLSKIVPGLVEELKHPIFNASEDQIIEFLNARLKGNKNLLLGDESNESNEFNGFQMENFSQEELEFDDEELKEEISWDGLKL